MTTPPLLDAETAAAFAGVRPATLRVWRHRYGFTPHLAPDGSSRYDLVELAAVLERRLAGANRASGLDNGV